ncbi:MAG: acyl transferase [Nostoc sp.]|uniref:acyl transferase n=1 Tax=Nostoc sp. TaxID=1180 RepID=UPI002FF7F595
MTVISKILSFFPTFILLLTGAAIIYLAYSPNIFSILAVLLSIYGLPVLVYRLHEWVYPVREGISYLLGKEYSPWWGSHQIQVIYIAIPVLEAVLRLIPGVFSCWLRLWGAKVGRDVYWTTRLEIADRSLLEIGDRVVVGHGVGIYCHIIKPRKQNLMLYVKKVQIGSNVFVGAGSNLAPGVVVADGSYLPAATKLYPNQKVQ